MVEKWSRMTETREERCRRYRRRILEVARGVPAAHVAPAFSCLEIVDCIYHEVLRPQDTFVMSKGHGCLAQYVLLEDLGKLPRAALDHFGRPAPDLGPDSYPELGGHPSLDPGVGISASTGSLGHGLSMGAGVAFAERVLGTGARVYVLISDGELQCGSTWEAVQFAANQRLGNLVAVVDANGWGGMERMSAAFPVLAPADEKFGAFDWAAREFDGHAVGPDFAEWLRYAATVPRVAVCRTVKGKGVSFIEAGMPGWHYRSPTAEEYERAMEELR